MAPEVTFPHLEIEIQTLPRVIGTFFGIQLYWYGAIIAFAVFCGFMYVHYESKRTNQSTDMYSDFIVWALIFAIIGARAYYVIFAWDSYKYDLIKIFALREGGVAIYGAVITGLITAIVYSKVKKVNFWLFIDTLVPGLMIGQVIGRYGNFFNREAHGGYTDCIFAMRYLINSSYVPENLKSAIVNVNGYNYLQVHPTFLYESLWNLTFFIFILFYKKHKKFDGEILLIYLFTYGTGRFWIEGLRTDNLLLWGTNIAISQVVAILSIVISIVLYYILKKKKGDIL